ncbi:MFS transporter [Bartonella bacilliformis]|uniref:MFS transporter n=1 Tax=Bartonella bacilliformis TaxID=774 RepID=UPI00044F65BD|nr:MFS transporter [Bartonella bacilliformis]EYS94616.1 hypothetical protein X470_00906 [Bartonella bacilliformis Peru-18]KEG17139.1 hypothetical protein H709_00800 [Bartonella bacilliformis CUSCO5]KZM37770.1 MFS transporter [Bartonella bacilliformis]
MLNKYKPVILQFCICLMLTFASLADETAQITFALTLAENTHFISMLLSTGLLCGILANFSAPLLLHQFGAYRLIINIFYIESLLIVIAAFVGSFWAYICLAAGLGSVLALLWSAVMVAIPDFAQNEHQLDWINRVVQTMRNFGYIGGPILGSLFFTYLQHSYGLIYLAILVLCAGFIVLLCFNLLKINNIKQTKNEHLPHSTKKHLDFIGLFKKKTVFWVLLPLVITIAFSSAENVILIIYIRKILQFDATSYGWILSSTSIGLVVGPLLFTGFFKPLGEAPGACLAAAGIGTGIFCLSLTSNIWVIIISSLLIGISNGVQNTLMATFMMNNIKKDERKQQMPAYIFIVQSSVLAGFFSAGFIALDYIQISLTIIGIMTILAGCTGIIANLYQQKFRPKSSL